jgi:hypothetical protein
VERRRKRSRVARIAAGSTYACGRIDDNHPAEAAEAMSIEAAQRFARLQRRLGHWPRSRLHRVILRADWYASASQSLCFQPGD